MLVAVGLVLALAAMPAMLGDPGSGGVTEEFERTKAIGAYVELGAMVGVPALLALLHLQILRADRDWKLAAMAARQPLG